MEIRIKAIDERSPETNKPLFELWIDGKYEGKMHECIRNQGNAEIQRLKKDNELLYLQAKHLNPKILKIQEQWREIQRLQEENNNLSRHETNRIKKVRAEYEQKLKEFYGELRNPMYSRVYFQKKFEELFFKESKQKSPLDYPHKKVDLFEE